MPLCTRDYMDPGENDKYHLGGMEQALQNRVQMNELVVSVTSKYNEPEFTKSRKLL